MTQFSQLFFRAGRRSSLGRTVAMAALAAACGAPARAAAQHEHRPPSGADTTRTDSAARPTARDTMAHAPATPGMAHGGGHDMRSMMEGPLGVSHVRMGSGTSWMPDSSPMHANHKMWGDWTVMLHGVAFGVYDDQGSKRGDRQLGVVDWEMLMAMRRVGSGMLHLHAMASLEPATLGAKGYPLLLQTGEAYRGQPLHDRQHPHDLIMELATMFQQPVGRSVAVELYGGLAGEPALGPVAFMHRPSAQNDPFSPLGHHWQDATHISYGVLTAGLYSRLWKLEGSWFNGREPDENRWNVELRRLDSYSGRLTLNPTGRLSVASWYGYLPSPEALHPAESVHRYGVSALYGGRGIAGGAWGSMLLWGANGHGGRAENSVVAETNLEIGRRNALFARAEYVRKSAEELVLPTADPERQFDVRSLVGGYVREVASIPGGSVGVGGRVSVNFVPGALEPFYGTRTPAGFALYVRVRPKRMATERTTAASLRDTTRMPGMPMPGMAPHAPGHDAPTATPTATPAAGDSADARRDTSGAVRGTHDAHEAHEAHDTVGATAHDSSMHDASTHDAIPSHAGNDSAARRTRSEKAPAARKKPPARKSPAGKPAARKPAAEKPAAHHMPGMQHMPGMKMPTDSTQPRKP